MPTPCLRLGQNPSKAYGLINLRLCSLGLIYVLLCQTVPRAASLAAPQGPTRGPSFNEGDGSGNNTQGGGGTVPTAWADGEGVCFAHVYVGR